jgi:hypothetical protein
MCMSKYDNIVRNGMKLRLGAGLPVIGRLLGYF